MILDAGTIVDAGTASLYIQLGANFIVSPYLKEDMGITCNRRKTLWIPGCSILNDIAKAEEVGAEVCKIFPADSLGGPGFIKDIKAPCPWTNILATGGIKLSRESISQWLKAGAWCLGMGYQLMPKEAIQNKQMNRAMTNSLIHTGMIIKGSSTLSCRIKQNQINPINSINLINLINSINSINSINLINLINLKT